MLGALFFSAALVFTEQDAEFAFSCASNLVASCTPRDAGTPSGERAANWIFDAVRQTGAMVQRDAFRAPMRLATGKTEQRIFSNLHATFRKSPDAPWTLFVSHYDTKPGSGCPGANDGASTSGLLIALASALSKRGYEGKANICLMWLDGEECIRSYGSDDGFWGSKHAALELQRREMNVRAVVCLDMLGDRKLAITIPSNGSPTLMKIAKIAARHVDVTVSLIADTMKDDHVAFLEMGYPAIDLIDFDYGSSVGRNDWWHTSQDTIDKVSRESLLKSGRLVAELVNILAK